MSLASERVVEILVDAGYVHVGPEFTVSGIVFRFDAILFGPDRVLDMVVVADCNSTGQVSLSREIRALARSLDVVGSRRSLNCVAVGGVLDATIVHEILSVARLLRSAGPHELETAHLRITLEVLLPLRIPIAEVEVLDPLHELRAQLGEPSSSAEALIGASSAGESAVNRRLGRLIVETIEQGPG